MATLMRAVELHTETLTLEPLGVHHADEMVAVLADESTYEFIGGTPPTLADLRARYAAQAGGESPDGRDTWLNYVIRLQETGEAVGYVQATVADADGLRVADIAWVVAPRFHRRGIATAAAGAMAAFLREHGVRRLQADVHPDHAASQGVAAALGLRASGEVVDGEVRWVG